mgnify:CR=1 FL=1
MAADRYATAAEFKADLCNTELRRTTRSPTRVATRRRLVWMAAIAGVAVMGAWALRGARAHTPDPNRVVVFPLAATEAAAIGPNIGWEVALAIVEQGWSSLGTIAISVQVLQ